MLPYFLLLGVSALLCGVCVVKEDRDHHVFLVGKGEYTRVSSIAIPGFFAMLFILLACRADVVGNDTKNYIRMFEKYGDQPLQEAFQNWLEIGFRLINMGIYQVTENPQIYLAMIALIEVIPLAFLYSQDRRHSYLKIVLFVNMSTFIMMFSGIRQAIAVSLGALVFDGIHKGRKKSAFAWAIAAALIHISGFMTLLLFPLCAIRINRKHLWAAALVLGSLLIFGTRIFQQMIPLIEMVYSKAAVTASSTGAFGMIILFAMLNAFVFIISDEDRMDAEAFALRNILLIALFMQCFAPVHVWAMRMNYYFIIFVPLAVGKSLCCVRRKYCLAALWGERVLYVFFTIYFLCDICISYITGDSALNTVPYVPFWGT